MACRIEGKRETSPISSAQVNAVIGPTPGTVLRRLIRSASKGSRCSELTRAYSVFCSRTMLSLLQPQQRPDSLIHLLVGREQLTEVAHFVQPLLVVTHSGFHQQTRDPILDLHHLAHQQVAVAQRSTSVPNRGRGHVALRQENRSAGSLRSCRRQSDRSSFSPLQWRAASACATLTCCACGSR